MDELGIVVIGRNEGNRLIDCLHSILTQSKKIVYVDSNSTDGSVFAARDLGIQVVELDMSLPFTAARARNAGSQLLINLYPDIQYLQFVDGDCIVDSTWLDAAKSFLEFNSGFGVVCGRRRERFPDQSIYNYMCDLEWNTPIGEAKSCGGDFLIRKELFTRIQGFDETLIAGEEPELCIRVRRESYKIMRLDQEMTLHDASMSDIGQWWKRSSRAGHAFAEGAHMYGRAPECHWVAESLRAWLWAFVLPVFIILLSVQNMVFVAVFLIYPMQIVRLAAREGITKPKSVQIAFFSLLGKFAELQGQLRYWLATLFRLKSSIMEYK